jgi:hypothetical protein
VLYSNWLIYQESIVVLFELKRVSRAGEVSMSQNARFQYEVFSEVEYFLFCHSIGRLYDSHKMSSEQRDLERQMRSENADECIKIVGEGLCLCTCQVRTEDVRSTNVSVCVSFKAFSKPL